MIFIGKDEGFRFSGLKVGHPGSFQVEIKGHFAFVLPGNLFCCRLRSQPFLR
jgi:hypothetical protein